MSVLKWQVNSSSHFELFFIVIAHKSSVNFKVKPFLPSTKGSHLSPNFDTLKCSGENLLNFSCHFSNHKPFFLHKLHNSLWKIIPMYFCSPNVIYFGDKKWIKTNFLDFQVLGSKFVKFLMPILKWQVGSSSILFLFIFMAHNSSVNFKLIHFPLWTEGSDQSSNFDTFECSGEILPNSWCHFPNGKSIPLKILYPSSVSWKIALLYFFSSNNIYFAQKEPLKVKMVWDFWVLRSKPVKFLMSILNEKSVPFQILYPSSVSRKITPLYFFSSNNIYFVQKDPIKVKLWHFQVLRSKFLKFLVSILKRQIYSSPNILSLFSFMKDISSVLLSLKQ